MVSRARLVCVFQDRGVRAWGRPYVVFPYSRVYVHTITLILDDLVSKAATPARRTHHVHFQPSVLYLLISTHLRVPVYVLVYMYRFLVPSTAVQIRYQIKISPRNSREETETKPRRKQVPHEPERISAQIGRVHAPSYHRHRMQGPSRRRATAACPRAPPRSCVALEPRHEPLCDPRARPRLVPLPSSLRIQVGWGQ